jgi:hypothetical protein
MYPIKFEIFIYANFITEYKLVYVLRCNSNLKFRRSAGKINVRKRASFLICAGTFRFFLLKKKNQEKNRKLNPVCPDVSLVNGKNGNCSCC